MTYGVLAFRHVKGWKIPIWLIVLIGAAAMVARHDPNPRPRYASSLSSRQASHTQCLEPSSRLGFDALRSGIVGVGITAYVWSPVSC